MFTALLLIFSSAAGGSLAYLYASSDTAKNSFKEVHAAGRVKEEFDGTEKRNVSVVNTGDIDVWVRVSLVPAWEDDRGNAVNQAADLNDLNLSFGTGAWFKASDGRYYCSVKISPGSETPVLINSAAVNPSSEGFKAGYHMNLQILCETIQAEPHDAVESAWQAVRVSGGRLEGK